MNRLPLLEREGFPLDQNALNDLQNLSREELQAAIVAIMANNNCIISGVTNTTGNNYSDGIVIINGEILPFVASAGTYLAIEEEIDTADVDGAPQPVLIRRWAKATATTTVNAMSSIRRVAKANVITKANTTTVAEIKHDGMYGKFGASGKCMIFQTEAGFSSIQGMFLLAQSVQFVPGWVTLFDLKSATDSSLLQPWLATNQAMSITFDGYAEPGNVPTRILLRITPDGLLQVRHSVLTTYTSAVLVSVNVTFFNPQDRTF